MASLHHLENLRAQLEAKRKKVCEDTTLSSHILDQYIREMMELQKEIQELEKTLPENEPTEHNK